jgi:ATP-dependent RNA helicase DeaD
VSWRQGVVSLGCEFSFGEEQPKPDMPKNNNSGSMPPKRNNDFKAKRAWAPKGSNPRGRSQNPGPERQFIPPVPTVVEETTFSELGLMESTLRAITDLGFEIPTPIQALAIPVLLTGCDFIGLAQTGTGKTAAFGLPMIEKMDPSDNTTQALILAPTRELAIQVAKGLHDFAKYGGLKVVPVYGGQPIDRQFLALRGEFSTTFVAARCDSTESSSASLMKLTR